MVSWCEAGDRVGVRLVARFGSGMACSVVYAARWRLSGMIGYGC